MKRLFVSLAFAVCLISCCQKNQEYRYTRYIVGSPCEIKFSCGSDTSAKEIISEIDNELVRIDSLLNRFSEKSLVSELNRSLRVQAPQDIIYLFALSDSIGNVTDGLFDISIAPLMELWGFYKHTYQDPDTEQIMKTRELVDYSRIMLKGDSIIIPQGMKVDLGGIAQGYAADRVKLILDKHNITCALINIGGEIVAMGRSSKHRPWNIGIQNPRSAGVIETLAIQDQALSTSGDYEKFFLVNNKRYPHIINPKTGFPALDFASVTIIAERAAFADAIATATAVMGPERGIKFLDSLGIRGIIYYERDGALKRVETK